MTSSLVSRERAAYVGAVLSTLGLLVAMAAQFEIEDVTPAMSPWALGVLSVGFLGYSFIYLRWYA